MSDLYHNDRFTITEAPIDEANFILDKPHREQTMPFRLLDDDEEVYFIGLMRPTQTEALFYPLDTLGASYGCTDIQIKEKGRWTSV